MSNIVHIGNRKNSVKLSNIYDDAREIVESQEEYLKRQLEEARRQGFESGKMAAFNELEKEFIKRLNERSSQFEEYIESINQKVEDYEKSLEALLVELSFIFSEKILKREIEKETIIVETINNAANKIAGALKIVIKINPEDYEFIKSTNQNILADEAFSKVIFEKDEKIEKGGCLIESDIGSVDARINSQFNELKQKISTNFISNIS